MKRLTVALLLIIFCLFAHALSVPLTGADLNPFWARHYGEDREEIMYKIREMPDGGFLCVGYKVARSGFGKDVYIVRTDYDGRFMWEREYGAKDNDYGYDIIRARDGNFLIVGSTKTSSSYDRDIYMVKIDVNGNLIWEKEVRAPGYDEGYSVVRDTTGDMFIAGSNKLTAFHMGDASLTKTDPNGNLLWRRIYERYLEDEARSLIMTPDGGFILAGSSQSYGNERNDVFLLGTDSQGNFLWNKTYGGDGDDSANQIIACTDGNYLIVGSSDSYTNGESDIYLLKVDPAGNLLWEGIYGGDSDDFGNALMEDKEGNILVTGTTFSYGAGSSDAFVLKTTATGEQLLFETVGGIHADTSQSIITSFGKYYVLGGSLGSHLSDFYLVKFSLQRQLLNISSQFGETYGGGTYYRGANVSIGVESEVVYEGNYTRYIFSGWSSDSEYGYNGFESTVNISLMEDLSQVAKWSRQYYVKVSKIGEGNVTGEGWYNENTYATLEAIPKSDNYFVKWEGEGESSYSGTKQNITIKVIAPITQTTYFSNDVLYVIEVSSKYGDVSAPKVALIGSSVTVSINPETVAAGSGSRYIFQGWAGEGINSRDNPMKLEIEGNTAITVIWKKQYLVTEKYIDLGLSGWYTEGTVISLDPQVEGDLLKRILVYSINGVPTNDNMIVVDGVITISGKWVIDYVSLLPLLGVVVLIIVAGVAYFQKHKSEQPRTEDLETPVINTK